MQNILSRRGDVTFKLNPSNSFTQGYKKTLSIRANPELRDRWIDSRLKELEPGFPRGFRDFPNLYYEETEPRRALGLSEVWNSTRGKTRYGMGGITRYGRIEVQEILTAMEQTFGTRRLSFITCTVPRAIGQIPSEKWSSIINELTKEIRRHLSRLGSETHYVYVSELHEKPLREKGQIWPHLHMVIVGRKHENGKWLISTAMLDSLWEIAVSRVMGRLTHGVSFKASCQIAAVRKSSVAYMAKYMSKGEASTLSSLSPDQQDFVPRSWWGASYEAKNLRKSLTVCVSGQEASDLLDYLEAHEECPYRYFQYKKIPFYSPWYRSTNWSQGVVQAGEWIAGSFGTLTGWAAAIAREMFPRSAPDMNFCKDLQPATV